MMSSLGVSFEINENWLEQIKYLILTKGLNVICFVLSKDNRIVHDVLSEHQYSTIHGLENFYAQILNHKKQSDLFWQTNKSELIISYYLHQRIKELKTKLNGLVDESPEIQGKIYDRESNTFSAMLPDLICEEAYSLN